MTRKLLSTFFALVFGLTFILTAGVNAQTGSVEVSPYISSASPTHGINDMWDVQLSFDVTAATGAAGNAGSEFDGTYCYTTRWASNLIHKYDMSGNLVEEFSIPGVSGLRDLAFDGTYFYGGAASNTIYQMDFTTKTLLGTIPSPVAVRYIAYDEGSDAFWCGNWNDNPTLVSRSGTTLASFASGLTSQYGAAYDNVSAGGPYLWIFDQGSGAGTPQIISQFDIASGTATGVTHDVMTDVGMGNTSAIAGGLFTTSDFVSGTFSLGGLLQGVPDMYFVYELGPSGGGTISIAQAIEDLDNDFVPDHLGETVTVQGVVFSPNYQTSNNSFYISDGTAGTDIFMYGPPVFMWNSGDMLEITGEVSQYNGVTEIIPADSTGWVFVSSGNPTPEPVVLTLGQYLANAEMYEGSLVGFVALTLVGGTWPGAGSSANLSLSDGIDTVTFRIDSDTDIDGQPEPSWPADVIGIGSQYDTSPPYDGGYQVFPRYYATDFLPPGTLPVELTSFTAEANLNSVVMNWSTASELNNHGFEIQRNNGNGYATIGFVQGQGTSTQAHSYSYVDQDVPAGHYTYRLKQMDFQGSYSFSSEVSVDINPVTYSLEQNYPNPFNPSTIINFNLKVDSKVSLKVFNILGQEVTQLINGAMTAGNHRVDFNASKLTSGVYLYRLEATGIDGSSFSAIRKMMLTK